MIDSDRDARAFLDLLGHVIVFVRFRSSGPQRLSDEHLHDLMDAVHNVPEMLTKPDGYFNPQMMREVYFGSYEAKWGDQGLKLNRFLDDFYARIDSGVSDT